MVKSSSVLCLKCITEVMVIKTIIKFDVLVVIHLFPKLSEFCGAVLVEELYTNLKYENNILDYL